MYTTHVPGSSVPHELATLALDQLASQIDALLAAWDADAGPPDLAKFLPAEPPGLRQLMLVELIKVDLEYRWKGRRFPKLLEEYSGEFVELGSLDDLPAGLIYEEYHARRQAGDPVRSQDYLLRFPRQAESLRRLLDLEAPLATTTLTRVERPRQLFPGQTVDDFDLLAELGKGAFASVFLARQRSMQRIVALKVSRDRGSEPQTMAQLDHPHIVRVYDQRFVPEGSLRLLYMQHIPGGTLQTVVERAARAPEPDRSGSLYLTAVDEALEKQGQSPPGESSIRRRLAQAQWPEVVCWLGSRLAAALGYAHERGVLHRDVKPANVLVAADGSPKLADFNISFSSKLEGSSPAAYFGGSLAYMSPEQLEACNPAEERQPESLDGRSDVYSLGVMLWELLTGKRPFSDEAPSLSGEQTLSRMTARRKEGIPPEAVARLPRNCPRGLVDALRKCMAFDVAERFESAEECMRALDLCLQPKAQRLLESSSVAWREFPRRHPLLAMVVAGVAPNALMSVLNIAYNHAEIIKLLSEWDQRIFFQILLVAINVVAYGVGISWMYRVALPVHKNVQQVALGVSKQSENWTALRRRALWLGDYTAWLTIAEWIISGLAFPAGIYLFSTLSGSDSQLQLRHWLHFISSQFLCGLIAATLTFFCVTFLEVRFYYPWLTRPKLPGAGETREIVKLGRRIWAYFGLAVSVPFIAVTFLVLMDIDKAAIGVLGAVGLVGFGFSFLLTQLIRVDLGALVHVVDPTGASLALGGDTSDSFWTSSSRQ